MNPDITHIKFGPPGTGKTHDLLMVVEMMLESGIRSEEICFIAFTRKAANEARDRAREKFKLNDSQIPWFRTFHSMAFKQLGLSKNNIMGFRDYLAICGQLGLSITFRGASEDGVVLGLSRGDRLFFMENMARAQMMTLKDYWEKFPDEDIAWYELELLSKTLEAYKQSNGKRDFTDIVYAFNNSPVVPDLYAMIVDEAQDLTPLQWQMAEHIATDVEEIYLAGDDDQAIFRWAGADVDRFINMPGSRFVLPRSYRVPSLIQEVAERIVGRIDTRVAKEWEPTKDAGEVAYANDVEQIDMSQGTWLLLARNVFLLDRYVKYCMQMGYVFDSSTGSPIRGASLRAVVAWENLRKGLEVPWHLVRQVYDLMSVKNKIEYGYKTKVDKMPDEALTTMVELRSSYGLATEEIWHLAFDKMDWQEREYFLSALRRGEKLLKEPRIRINTIHGVKGGEADHVVVQTDMAERTYSEYVKSPDDEHRVWYVAVTRARKSLHILSPRSKACYEI